jgi:hypothetical protein
MTAARVLSAFVVVAVALAALLPLLAHGAVPFRVCEDAKQRQLPNGGPEVQLVYNEKRREYFGVHLTYDGDHSSVMGQRFDERGSPVGSVIPVFPWRDGQPITSRKKQFPVVALNTITGNYLVAWEFDFTGDGKDWDVVARVVSGDGTPLDPGPFFLASSFGREDSPHLAFSPKDQNFVLVHEVDSSGVRGIAVQRLNETHSVGEPILLNTSYVDREPFIAYHPPSNEFLLVWEWDQNNDNKSEIGAVIVGGMPLQARNTVPNVVGSTIEIIGGQRTYAHDHDAQLVYSPQQDSFLLTWEVDGDSGEKEVVCSLVSPLAQAVGGLFRVVGNASHPFDRKPSAVYSPFSDEYFIAYESGPNKDSTGIEGVAFSAKGLVADTDPFPVSQALDREHAPALALSSTCGNILALWSSETSLSRRSSPVSPQSNKPVATFAEAITQPQAREEKSAGELTARTYTPRSKFSTSGKGGAVAHVYLPLQQDDLPSKVRISVTDESDTAAVKSRSSAATLQAIRVCLPGRGSCSAAGTPLPVPSTTPAPAKEEGGGSNAMGVVLGLLGAALVLAGLGVGGFLGWRRFPQIREWWESRRSGAPALGSWAEESEFSISVDAFSNDESAAHHDDDDHH